MFRFELTGDWAQATAFFNTLPYSLVAGANSLVESQGNFLAQELKDHIWKQDLGWVPLAEATVLKKEIIGASQLTLVEWGTFAESITANVFVSGDDISVYVYAAGENLRAPNDKIAMWHEFGTSRMPARPLFNPTFNENEALLKSQWADLVSNAISDAMRASDSTANKPVANSSSVALSARPRTSSTTPAVARRSVARTVSRVPTYTPARGSRIFDVIRTTVQTVRSGVRVVESGYRKITSNKKK